MKSCSTCPEIDPECKACGGEQWKYFCGEVQAFRKMLEDGLPYEKAQLGIQALGHMYLNFPQSVHEAAGCVIDGISLNLEGMLSFAFRDAVDAEIGFDSYEGLIVRFKKEEVKNMEDGLTTNDFQLAIDLQDACNLSGVAISFAEVMKKICAEANKMGKGTLWKNMHPIAILYINKMASLTGECVSGGVIFDEAYRTCIVRSKKKDGKRL